jgi:predicted PurR-regulated permease PerM
MTIERVLMALLLSGIGIGCALVLLPFLSALLWGGILTYTTWPIYEHLRARLRLRASVAAGLMVLLAAVMMVLPLAVAVPTSAQDVDHLRRLVQDALKAGLPASPAWVFDIPLAGHAIGDLWNSWSADISIMADALRPYFGMIAEYAFGLLLGVANGVLGFALALFIAFFLYANGELLAARIRAILRRITGDYADRLITLTGATMRGTVYGILGTALVQGILTATGLWIAGVPRAVLLGLLAGVLAVLPVGAPLVWIPAALWLASAGHWGAGLFLAIYGVVAVSGADQVIRPLFIARGAQLPFLLVILGVLGGALAFGLLGIFLGPVLLGIGYTWLQEFAANAPGDHQPQHSGVENGDKGR